MAAGYEIWDRFERAFIGDFDALEHALAFLDEMVRQLSPEAAADTLDPFQLVEVGEDGTTTPKFAGRRDLGQLLAYRAYAADPERQAVARADQQELRRRDVL